MTHIQVSREEIRKRKALTVLGDLSTAPLHQLFALYDTVIAVWFAWQGGHNMPRSGFEGEDMGVCMIMDEEASRCFYFCEAIVDELRRRPLAEDNTDLERARVYLDWLHQEGADDLSLAEEIARISARLVRDPALATH